MTADGLIKELRKQADIVEYPEMAQVMREAADRLEDLDERVSIMEEGKHNV